jgi:tetratricopeptide (TPR) repeat protein
MKRKLLVTLWLLLPVLLLAYHSGPGQSALAHDKAAAFARQAGALEKSGDWENALENYRNALAALPPNDKDNQYRLRLAAANARMYTGELPEAMQDMDSLLSEVRKTGGPASAEREVRGNLASAQYYAGWLMRLENASTEEWLEQTENSRQNFRLLAEQTQGVQPGSAEDYAKNLEAVIRLERMDLSELQGLPLPKQCQGCKNCSQKCRGQKASRSPQPKEKPKDARGAGVGKRPEGSGS